jgi:4-aminobutyrate aminotransferase
MKIKIKTKIPGPKSQAMSKKMKRLNGGWSQPLPILLSGEGEGCYFKDADKNVFLDFASQIASNPLGYDHPNLKEVLSRYNRTPIKIAGQDFHTKEHLALMEELLSISPTGMNQTFLINSGAEADENAMKICIKKHGGVYGVSFDLAFHGRTQGALSFTNSKVVHSKGYWQFPSHRIPFNDCAPDKLEQLIKREGGDGNVSFVIIESVQGEGGYRIASKKMIKGIRKVTKEHGIPLICDEVQSGMGRTGKWWAFEHFGIKPDVFASAKALQVGAVVANKNMFPPEPGAISSTWGGGHILDLALGVKTIQTIKKDKLLENCTLMGNYLVGELNKLGKEESRILNARGLGLMCAFDLHTKEVRDHLHARMLERGLVTLGAGHNSIRLIPPYIVTKSEIDEAIGVISDSLDSEIKKHKISKECLGTGEHTS